MKPLIHTLFIIAWLIGIVMAKGFWSTLVAVIFPFWGYYLLAEYVVLKYLQ
jgi:hypothetical protein